MAPRDGEHTVVVSHRGRRRYQPAAATRKSVPNPDNAAHWQFVPEHRFLPKRQDIISKPDRHRLVCVPACRLDGQRCKLDRLYEEQLSGCREFRLCGNGPNRCTTSS